MSTYNPYVAMDGPALQAERDKISTEISTKDKEKKRLEDRNKKLNDENKACTKMNNHIENATKELNNALTYAEDAKDEYKEGYISANREMTRFNTLTNSIKFLRNDLNLAKKISNDKISTNAKEILDNAKKIEEIEKKLGGYGLPGTLRGDLALIDELLKAAEKNGY